MSSNFDFGDLLFVGVEVWMLGGLCAVPVVPATVPWSVVMVYLTGGKQSGK